MTFDETFSFRMWRWSKQQYTLVFENHQWTVRFSTLSIRSFHAPKALMRLLYFFRQASINGTAVASFRPYRHHMFGRNEPASLQLTRGAQEDEVFLILVFIYSEMKRLDKKVCFSFSFFFFYQQSERSC
jgi:hypothetical protein